MVVEVTVLVLRNAVMVLKYLVARRDMDTNTSAAVPHHSYFIFHYLKIIKTYD
jgi:hypothetical protein